MEQPAQLVMVPTRGQAVSHYSWLQPGPLGAQMEMVIRRNPTRGGSQSKDRHHPNSFYGPLHQEQSLGKQRIRSQGAWCQLRERDLGPSAL